MSGGRPAKSLLELVRCDGFRMDRHTALISVEPLPETAPEWADDETWKALCWAQAQYVKYERGSHTRDAWMAEDYRRAFSRCVRALHGGRLPWLLGGSKSTDRS